MKYIFIQLICLNAIMLSNFCFAQECTIDEVVDVESGKTFLRMHADGVTIDWKKSSEGKYNNYGGFCGEFGCIGDVGFYRIFPVLKDGNVVTDGRTLAMDDIDTALTSKAVYACESQGLHLPTKAAFNILAKCKDSERAKFADVNNSYYWTSSRAIMNIPRYYAYYFDVAANKVSITTRAGLFKVRCIKQRALR